MHALRWESLDTADGAFAFGWAPRNKTARPQLLEIPEMLRPLIRDWWERAGKPATGLLFAARRGKHAGTGPKIGVTVLPGLFGQLRGGATRAVYRDIIGI